MIQAIYEALTTDTLMIGILTGGLHRAVEISRFRTPAAFDGNGEILPCGLLKGESQVPQGPHANSARLYVTLYFYEQTYDGSQPDVAGGLGDAGAEDDNDTYMDLARKRAYALLHNQRLTPVDGSGCYLIRHVNDTLGQEDPVLGVQMQLSRFMCVVER